MYEKWRDDTPTLMFSTKVPPLLYKSNKHSLNFILRVVLGSLMWGMKFVVGFEKIEAYNFVLIFVRPFLDFVCCMTLQHTRFFVAGNLISMLYIYYFCCPNYPPLPLDPNQTFPGMFLSKM